MANTKVRGITIELGADVSGLQNGLKKINTEIGDTQRQLKDVERMLKLDPGNTELLEQKQRLLNDRIGETKTKLEALKEAQKQVSEEMAKTGKGQEQYDALQREIVNCEKELEQLERKASNAVVALEKIGAAGAKLESAGKKISSVGDSLTRNVSVPLAAAGAGIIKVAGDFEEQMAKVSSIAQAYGSDLDALKDKAQALSETSQFSATEIAQAYEYMGMAGWNTNQILAGTEGIINLATASGEDLANVSDIVTDGLTAFGLTAEDTGRFVNALAEAARSSNTNVGMMGESFKYVAPVAGAMGYELEDVAIALGTMANSGIKSSLAGTTLRNILNRMAKPTKESAMAMDRLGLSLTNDQGEMKTFAEIMDDIRGGMYEINMPLEEYNAKLDELDKALEDGTIKQNAYDKEVEELNKQAFGAAGAEKARAASMLGGTRAMAGLMAIASATDEEYKGLTDSIKNSSQTMAMTTDGAVMPLTQAMAEGKEIAKEFEGTAAAMAGTMNNTTNVQMKQLRNQVENLAIDLGNTLLPMLRDVLTVLNDWVQDFRSLSPETQEVIIKIGLFVAALGPVLSVGGRLLSGIGSFMQVLPKIPGAITAIAQACGNLTPMLSSALSSIGSFFTADLGATMASGGAAAAGTACAAIAGSVVSFFAGAEIGKKIGAYLFPSDAELYQSYSGLKGTIDMMKDLGIALKDFFVMTWEDNWKSFKKNWDILEKLFEAGISAIQKGWNTAWEGMKKSFENVMNSLERFFKDAINNGIIRNLNKASSGLKNLTGGHVDLGTIDFLAEGGTVTNGGAAIVGEAGAELLTVQNGQAVVQPLNGQSSTNELRGLLETYLPYLAAQQGVYLDGDTLVGHTVSRMDEALGTARSRSAFA